MGLPDHEVVIFLTFTFAGHNADDIAETVIMNGKYSVMQGHFLVY